MVDRIDLIKIIDILSTHYSIQIGVDGNYVGMFDNVGDIPYKYLTMKVKCVYPGIIEKKEESIDGVTGLTPVSHRAVTRIDLIDDGEYEE